jgi:crotonobetainyl-CoA:carnitine CoA-transferase CaiB-like acyl-CoA transferase
VKALKGAGDVICTPVQSINDLTNDPQVLANDYIVECHHDVLGPVKVVGLPIRLSETPGEINCTAPELGQHTEEILLDVGGYTWEEIARLREEEVI